MEAAGIPTMAIVNHPKRPDVVKLPRAVRTKFPRGATVGTPGHPEQQTKVLTEAFDRLENAREPGEVLELPHRWERD